MLYYLFDYIERTFDFPGAGLFQYISFRAGAAAVLSLMITITFGKSLINYLRRKQVGESIRDLGLEGQMQKKGTPTMGGLIIIAAILIPTLLMATPNMMDAIPRLLEQPFTILLKCFNTNTIKRPISLVSGSPFMC